MQEFLIAPETFTSWIVIVTVSFKVIALPSSSSKSASTYPAAATSEITPSNNEKELSDFCGIERNAEIWYNRKKYYFCWSD